MDNIQQTDPQAADVGTTGDASAYDAIPTSELGMPETESAGGEQQTLGIAPEADPALRTDKGSDANPLTDADAAADLTGEPRPSAPAHGAFVIAPSVGRKVHFYPNGVNFHSTPYCIDPSVPMDADVVYVWGDRMVNLNVRDHIGQVHAFTSITLRQPDDAIPSGAYAEWMPFQAQQARASAGA